MKVFVALNTVCVSGDDGVRAESDEVPVPCPAPGRRNGIVFTAAVEDDDDLVIDTLVPFEVNLYAEYASSISDPAPIYGIECPVSSSVVYESASSP